MAIRRSGVGLTNVPRDSRYGLAMDFFGFKPQKTDFFRAWKLLVSYIEMWHISFLQLLLVSAERVV